MMKKKMLSAILTAAMMFGMTLNAQADGSGSIMGTEAVKENPEAMTAAGIIDMLYENEENQDVRQCAKTSSMILTGEIPVTDYHGMILIGTYESAAVYYHSNISVPAGNGMTKASITNTYTMVLPYDEYPTEEKAVKNKKALDLLYETVWSAKEETKGMTDPEKALYLTGFVCGRMEKKEPLPGRTATCLMNGAADCDGFSGLYHLLAINCGLQSKTVLGTFGSVEHAWNEVYLNGDWLIVDNTLGNYLISGKEAVELGYKLVAKTHRLAYGMKVTFLT